MNRLYNFIRFKIYIKENRSKLLEKTRSPRVAKNVWLLQTSTFMKMVQQKTHLLAMHYNHKDFGYFLIATYTNDSESV